MGGRPQPPASLLRRWLISVAPAAMLALAACARAHEADRPSLHDAVAGILIRFENELAGSALVDLTPDEALRRLTAEERQILASGHVTFHVSTPVRLSVIRSTALTNEPFWLRDRDFETAGIVFKPDGEHEFDVWSKTFPAGPIGLGVNSISGGGEHYFVTLAPLEPGARLDVTELYPGQLRLGLFETNAQPYVDHSAALKEIPQGLAGQTMIRMQRSRRADGRLIQWHVLTAHPASRRPDHVILTWAGDPRTTQAIQWRTSTDIRRGVVAYQKKSLWNHPRPRPLTQKRAQTEPMHTRSVINDSRIHWHTVQLTGLEPGTDYVYSVGDGTRDGWAELAEFRTAPLAGTPFAFIYMGDAQNGLDRWGTLLANAFRSRPDVAFYVMAGDLVNRGAERDDWDSLFYNARGVYDRRQLVPVLGNHECQGGRPDLYLRFFQLPRNGPASVEAERVYSFEYSNALFLVLDSNSKPEAQTAWIEEQLRDSQARWKFVTYHHPIYSSAPNRDNKAMRDHWAPLFDKYHVDLALQGHDHAYLRTWPMRGDKRVDDPKDGTIYVVSVSGTKFYAQDPRDYTAMGLTNVATFQVLDIQVSGDRLVYRAYDTDNRLQDELIIDK